MQVNSKISESSKSQNYTETNNSLNLDSKIYADNIKQIEGTIFNIANNPEKGWFLTIGHHIITECYPTQKEAIDQLELDKWNILMKMIILVVEKTIELKEKPNLQG